MALLDFDGQIGAVYHVGFVPVALGEAGTHKLSCHGAAAELVG
jgi:hypothetical protein